jgi:hypothetical protein
MQDEKILDNSIRNRQLSVLLVSVVEKIGISHWLYFGSKRKAE